MKRLVSLLAITLLASCSHSDHASDTATQAAPTGKVFFVSPKDGETVKTKFTAKFAVEGMQVKPASDMTPNTGHHHVIVDGAALAEGTVIPKDEKNLHFGAGQTEAPLTLKKGKHTLTLQFADGAHRSYGDKWSQTITVNVK